MEAPPAILLPCDEWQAAQDVDGGDNLARHLKICQHFHVKVYIQEKDI